MVQSGLHDLMTDDKRACAKTVVVNIDGSSIPFGAKVSNKPISSKDESRLHQFGIKMLPRCAERMVR